MHDEWNVKWERLLRQAMVNEAALSRLYARYAELFPAHGRTWLSLSRAEQKHADAFLALLEAGMPPDVGPVLERFDAKGMAAVERRLFDLLEKAHAGTVTQTRAVNSALALESSLAENLLAVFEPAPEGGPLRTTAGRLLRETRHHREMVMRLAAEAGAGS